MEPRPTLYTVAQVVAMTQMGERQVREAIIRGEIPAKRMGTSWRIPVVAFHRWCEDTGRAPREVAPQTGRQTAPARGNTCCPCCASRCTHGQ